MELIPFTISLMKFVIPIYCLYCYTTMSLMRLVDIFNNIIYEVCHTIVIDEVFGTYHNVNYAVFCTYHNVIDEYFGTYHNMNYQS